MPISALIRFQQGPTIGGAGEAYAGTVAGGVVTVTNGGVNAGVTSWTITLLSVPLGSLLVPGVIGSAFDAFPTATFVPDVDGQCYRIQLDITDGSVTDQDIRNFGTLNARGNIIPPPQLNPPPLVAKPNELNFVDPNTTTEQIEGWAGTSAPGLVNKILVGIEDAAYDALPLVGTGIPGDYTRIATPKLHVPTAPVYDGAFIWVVKSNFEETEGGGTSIGPGVLKIDPVTNKIVESIDTEDTGEAAYTLVDTGTQLFLFGVGGEVPVLWVREVLRGATTTFGPRLTVYTFSSASAYPVDGLWDGTHIWLSTGSEQALIGTLPSSINAPDIVLTALGGDVTSLVYDPTGANYGDGKPHLFVAVDNTVYSYTDLETVSPVVDGSYAPDLTIRSMALDTLGAKLWTLVTETDGTWQLYKLNLDLTLNLYPGVANTDCEGSIILCDAFSKIYVVLVGTAALDDGKTFLRRYSNVGVFEVELNITLTSGGNRPLIYSFWRALILNMNIWLPTPELVSFSTDVPELVGKGGVVRVDTGLVGVSRTEPLKNLAYEGRTTQWFFPTVTDEAMYWDRVSDVIVVEDTNFNCRVHLGAAVANKIVTVYNHTLLELFTVTVVDVVPANTIVLRPLEIASFYSDGGNWTLMQSAGSAALPAYTKHGEVLTLLGDVPDFGNPLSSVEHGGDIWFTNINAHIYSGISLYVRPGVTRVNSTTQKIVERIDINTTPNTEIVAFAVSTGAKLWLVCSQRAPAGNTNIILREVIVGNPSTIGPAVIIYSDVDIASPTGAVFDSSNNKLWICYQASSPGASSVVQADSVTGAPGVPIAVGLVGESLSTLALDNNIGNYGDLKPRLYVGNTTANTIQAVKDLDTNPPTLDGAALVAGLPVTTLVMGNSNRLYAGAYGTSDLASFTVNPLAVSVAAAPTGIGAIWSLMFDTLNGRLVSAIWDTASKYILVAFNAVTLAPLTSIDLPVNEDKVGAGTSTYIAIAFGYIWVPNPSLWNGFYLGTNPMGRGYRVDLDLTTTVELLTLESTNWDTVGNSISWRPDGRGDATTWYEVMDFVRRSKSPVTIYVDQSTDEVAAYSIEPGPLDPPVVWDMKYATIVAPQGAREELILSIRRHATLHNLAGIDGGMMLQHNHHTDDPPVLTFWPIKPLNSCVFKAERGAVIRNHPDARIPMIDWDGQGTGFEFYMVFNELGTVESDAVLSGAAASLAASTAPSMTLSGLTGMSAVYVGYAIQLSGAGLETNNKNFVITAYNSATSVEVNSDATIGFAPDPNNGAISWTFVIPVVRVRNKGVLEVTVATGGLGEDNMMPPGWLGCDGSGAQMVRWLHDGTLAFASDFWTQHQQLIEGPGSQQNTPMGVVGGSGDSSLSGQLPVYQGLGAPSDGTLFYDQKRQSLLAYSADESEWFVVGGRRIISSSVSTTIVTAVADDYPILNPGGLFAKVFARSHTIYMQATGVADITGVQFDPEFYNVPGPFEKSRPSSIRKTLVNESAFVLTMKNGAPSTNAVSTLTLSANVVDGDTVQFFAPGGPSPDDRIYTFKTTLTTGGGYAGEVLIGASASDSIDLLILAITGLGIPGVEYGIGTVTNTLVTAVAGAGDTMDVTSIEQGAWANGIEVGETSANMSWPGSFLTGGTGSLTRNKLLIAGGDLPVVPDGTFEIEYDYVLGSWRAV